MIEWKYQNEGVSKNIGTWSSDKCSVVEVSGDTYSKTGKALLIKWPSYTSSIDYTLTSDLPYIDVPNSSTLNLTFDYYQSTKYWERITAQVEFSDGTILIFKYCNSDSGDYNYIDVKFNGSSIIGTHPPFVFGTITTVEIKVTESNITVVHAGNTIVNYDGDIIKNRTINKIRFATNFSDRVSTGDYGCISNITAIGDIESVDTSLSVDTLRSLSGFYDFDYKNLGDTSNLGTWGSGCTVKSTENSVYSNTGKALYIGRSVRSYGFDVINYTLPDDVPYIETPNLTSLDFCFDYYMSKSYWDTITVQIELSDGKKILLGYCEKSGDNHISVKVGDADAIIDNPSWVFNAITSIHIEVRKNLLYILHGSDIITNYTDDVLGDATITKIKLLTNNTTNSDYTCGCISNIVAYGNNSEQSSFLIDTSRLISCSTTLSDDTARHTAESIVTPHDTARALAVSATLDTDTRRILSAAINPSTDTVRYVSCNTVIHADTVRSLAENIDVDMVADTARNLYRVAHLLDDTTRKISNLESINADVQRTVTADVIDMLDTVRTLTHTAGLTADTARDVSKSITVSADTARVMDSSTITLHADTSRQLANGTAVTLDTARNISLTLALSVDLDRDTGKISFDADVTRKLYKIVAVPVDTVRRIPHDLFSTKEPVFENHDTFTPFPQNVTKGAEKGIIDFKLVLEENTLSDKISADVIGFDYWPEDIIKGTFIDYPYEMKIESTQNTGARQTINAMHYKDRLLYTGMHYDGYHLYELNRNRNASYRYMLRAQWYVNRIKESLSLHVDSRFSNFTPESNFSDTDITYADLLSGLFGWSSQYPWRLVNVFLRGNTLYILQRGRENSVYDITNLPHAEPQIERSIYYSPYASNNKNNTYTSSRIKVPHDPMLDIKDPDDPDKPDEPDDSEYKDPNDGDTDQSVEVRFSVTIMGDHISQTYSNGLCVKEVHTVDAYDEMGGKYEKIDVIVERDYDGDDRCTYEQTNNADGTWRKTDTSYTSDGGVGLGSHSHTEDGDEYGVVQTSDTYTAYLGSGFTCTSTYVDGQFVSSSISGSGISNRTIPYTQNQQNAALKQGAASSDDNDDDINASRASRSSDAKTDPYIPTVDHSIRKQIQSEIDAYDRSVQETVSLEIIMPVVAGKPTMTHIIDFTERIKFNGAEYYLVRNTVDQTVSSLKQSIEITRWIRR